MRIAVKPVFSAYETLRKTNPTLYHDNRVQRHMQWAAQKYGDAFFDLVKEDRDAHR